MHKSVCLEIFPLKKALPHDYEFGNRNGYLQKSLNFGLINPFWAQCGDDIPQQTL